MGARPSARGSGSVRKFEPDRRAVGVAPHSPVAAEARDEVETEAAAVALWLRLSALNSSVSAIVVKFQAE